MFARPDGFASDPYSARRKSPRELLSDDNHKRGATSNDHFRLMARLALAGFAHAARCVHYLTVYYIGPQVRE